MSSINSLTHATRKLSNGGMVLALNVGADIDPEAQAMLQALHSRSTGGIKAHLETLIKSGSEKFMSSFYVGYGHKSIGDCGGGVVFIEGVSMLAAKAIQDWRLYSGQESSTRYIDFSKQKFINPEGSDAGNDILEEWRDFYLESLDPVQKLLKEKYPKGEEEKEITYDKAIAARAFDIMRGFLPAGASTNLAWYSNLRQYADKLMLLRHHPLAEVREIALMLEEVLEETFPNSFGHNKHEETESYNKWWMEKYNYYTNENPKEFALIRNDIDVNQLEKYRDVLEKRPMKTELPKFLSECGTVQFEFLLDFGSFRDIQRHRAVTQLMPLLTTSHGFGSWYLKELPKDLVETAKILLRKQEEAIKKLSVDENIAQYYISMGYNLPNRLTGDLPSLVYLIELRATRFVHPTLQRRATEMANTLMEEFGKSGLVLHLDEDPGRFDVKRGEHDIVKK
ncbi:MAG: FAD-dependent thymidylate synthase [Parcubacteria group bacterium]|nr:FAD-dependent thymidylate synthase [Parcubacteria group bacterium]